MRYSSLDFLLKGRVKVSISIEGGRVPELLVMLSKGIGDGFVATCI